MERRKKFARLVAKLNAPGLHRGMAKVELAQQIGTTFEAIGFTRNRFD
jgi:hypothetical protein